jgi:hypothetical protein
MIIDFIRHLPLLSGKKSKPIESDVGLGIKKIAW